MAQAALLCLVGADRAVDRVAHAAFPVTFLTVVIARVEFPAVGQRAVSGELLRGKLLAQLTVEPTAEGAVTCLACTRSADASVVRGKRYATRATKSRHSFPKQPVVGLTLELFDGFPRGLRAGQQYVPAAGEEIRAAETHPRKKLVDEMLGQQVEAAGT